MKTISAKIILIFISVALPFFSVNAISLKVSPSRMEIKMNIGGTGTVSFEVENPSQSVNLYETYVDNFSEFITLSPQSFILEGSQKKIIVAKITSPKEGIFSTDVSVVAKPLSDLQFKAGAGVKVPLLIRVEPANTTSFLATVSANFLTVMGRYGVWFLAALIISTAFIFIRDLKKRKKN